MRTSCVLLLCRAARYRRFHPNDERQRARSTAAACSAVSLWAGSTDTLTGADGSRGKTIVFFPEGAFGPTNNCVGIGEVLRRSGPPRGLRDRGVVRRDARGEGLRGAADAARAAARGRGGAGPVLEGLHPRDRARSSGSRPSTSSASSWPRPGRRCSTARATSTSGWSRSSTSSSPTRSSRTTSARSRRSRRAAGRGCGSSPAIRSSSRTRSCRRPTRGCRSTTAPTGTSTAPSTGAPSTRCRATSASSAPSAAPRRSRTGR